MKFNQVLGLGLMSAFLATSIGLGAVYAETPVQPEAVQQVPANTIDSVSYNASKGELVLNSHDGAALETRDVMHHPFRKELVFVVPNANAAPGLKEYKIENDPVVRSVTLLPVVEKGKPVTGTRVKVRLWTNAPFLPFMMVPSQPGLRLAFTRPEENTVVAETKSADVAAIAAQVKSLTTQPVTIKPVTVAAQPMSNPADSVLGKVSGDTFSVIQDVFYDENALTVVSKSHPIEIKRSFTLTEPNRYIVDISPAVLESKSLTRAIPQSNPDIVSLKTGQFDETTVRIVVQFADKVKPVDLSQWEGNKVLKLTFE